MSKISFPTREGLHATLQQRVNEYFDREGVQPTGDARMVVKTIVLLAWLAIAYVLLVFFSSSLLMAIISAYALSAAFALIGFNIMHDAVHGSYSRNKTVNTILGYTLDLVGGSQMLWRQKHNVLHHTYTNIEELDEDLQTFGLLRLSPTQKRRPWHAFQHYYAFAVYGLLTLSWVTFADFKKFFSRRIGNYQMPKPSVSEATMFFLIKLFYFGYTLVLPMFFHPVLHVLIAFVAIHLVLGMTIGFVFQLAHTVHGNSFPLPDPQTGHIEREWAVHQVQTTADFAPRNRVVTWLLGGLNFQVEHHLFSRICHVHYPALQKIVRDTCHEFGVQYNCYPSMRAALMAHFRFLRALGSQAS